MKNSKGFMAVAFLMSVAMAVSFKSKPTFSGFRNFRRDTVAMADVAGMSVELLSGVIVVAFIFALIPIVVSFISDANLTGAALILAGLVPFVLVAVGILVVVGLIRHVRQG